MAFSPNTILYIFFSFFSFLRIHENTALPAVITETQETNLPFEWFPAYGTTVVREFKVSKFVGYPCA